MTTTNKGCSVCGESGAPLLVTSNERDWCLSCIVRVLDRALQLQRAHLTPGADDATEDALCALVAVLPDD